MRTRGWLAAVLPVLGAVLTVTGSFAAEPLRLDRTRPDHLGPGSVEPIEPPPPADHVYRKVDVLAYRLPQAVSKWARVDPKLSRLCRLGAFGQQRPKALYAFAPNITYGIAFAEGANLHDPQKLATPGMVYFFASETTSSCMVLKAQRSQLAAFSTSKFGSPSAK